MYSDIIDINLEQIVDAARLIGAGCSTVGVIGAGVGIELFLVILF
jgi:hypothetical protein